MRILLTDPAAIYEQLSRLESEQEVPSDVYVLDYADGQQAHWIVVSRNELGANGYQLICQDRNNADLFNTAQVVIVAFPNKVLRSPVHLSDSSMPGQLCDMCQQARYVIKRG